MELATAVPGELRLTWAAACCAAEPGLDGLLIFDLPAAELSAVAAVLIQALTGDDPALARPRLVRLGSHEGEDDLWLSLRPRRADGVTTLMPAPGPLVRLPDEPALVVVVPDLARLSLAASRAAVALLGSPAAGLERHGRSRRWRTATYWVAACPAASAGQVSQHLLDRFAVRLTAGEPPAAADRVPAIMRALHDVPGTPLVAGLPPRWRSALARTASGPAIADAAIERAIALHDARHGMRRPLALLRLARATARLLGEPVVTAGHVREAALLTGLAGPRSAARPATPVARPARPDERRQRDEPRARTQARGPASNTATGRNVPDTEAAEPPVADPVLAGAPAETLDAITTSAPMAMTYPEDTADPDREAEPLRLPARRIAGRPADRGPVLGTVPARDLDDIAWFETVRHAALYRHFRQSSEPPGRLQITGADLHSYRRAAKPERMLALLLDHTCRNGWDWLPALAPYLHRAYSERAAICLVEVGGHGAASLLRAERSMLRSLLDPRVAAALSRPAGGSTPLAHGLTLIGQALRHALQHGDATLIEARAVIVTDGLGNVPLAASMRDRLTGPVGGTGVADAVDAARELRAFDKVRTVVIQPPRTPHPEILLSLVEALSSERALAKGP